MKTALLAAAAAAALSSLAAPARAEIIYFDMVGYATGSCQAALPSFEGQIRKRPLSVQNEGTATAHVTCSYPTGEGRVDSTSATLRVWQYFLNNGPAPVTIQCTGVTGDIGSGAQYLSKSTMVSAGSQVAIIWSAGEFPGSPTRMPNFGLFSVSCQLPPGAGLSNAYIDSITDVGN